MLKLVRNKQPQFKTSFEYKIYYDNVVIGFVYRYENGKFWDIVSRNYRLLETQVKTRKIAVDKHLNELLILYKDLYKVI